MPELRTPVNMIWVEYLCDECRSPLEYIGPSADEGVPYLHVCPRCQRRHLLRRTYPYTEEAPDALPQT